MIKEKKLKNNSEIYSENEKPLFERLAVFLFGAIPAIRFKRSSMNSNEK
jgi:hypothetical protein